MERHLERQCVLMPRTTTIIYGLHSEVPKGFQGCFGGYYAFAPGCPPPTNPHPVAPPDRCAGRRPCDCFDVDGLLRDPALAKVLSSVIGASTLLHAQPVCLALPEVLPSKAAIRAVV
jgi:hypothetical protein